VPGCVRGSLRRTQFGGVPQHQVDNVSFACKLTLSVFRLGAIAGQPDDTCVTARGHQIANLRRPEQGYHAVLRADEWSPRGPRTQDGPQANRDMSQRRLGRVPADGQVA
jgi:hypothetical protein